MNSQSPASSASSDVYAPDADSFLLESAVKKFAYGSVLDLGTGSGILAIAAAKKNGVSKVIATDVNGKALSLAKENAKLAGVGGKIKFAMGDLFSALKGEKFDCIVFNPPYLPTAKDEHVRGELDRAFDGGHDGRKITDRFISSVKSHLQPGGMVLLLSSSLASSKRDGRGNAETIAKFEKQGFKCKIAAREKFFFEELAVIRAVLRS